MHLAGCGRLLGPGRIKCHRSGAGTEMTMTNDRDAGRRSKLLAQLKLLAYFIGGLYVGYYIGTLPWHPAIADTTVFQNFRRLSSKVSEHQTMTGAPPADLKQVDVSPEDLANLRRRGVLLYNNTDGVASMTLSFDLQQRRFVFTRKINITLVHVHAGYIVYRPGSYSME
jgi:hypothetical protein